MSAIAIEGGVGPARALKLVSIKTPTPKSGEVLIRVAAAGNNYPDILQREGRYPLPPGTPATLGLEISGTVAVVGADMQRFRVGDPVCALLLGGGYAEYAAVDAHHVLPVPTGVNVLEAAALSETFFTVYANVFERGALKAGETLLVHGGTSGIGTSYLDGQGGGGKGDCHQSQRGKGASSEDARSRRVDRLEPAGLPGGCSGRGRADGILDMVGGEFVRKNLDALKPDGRLSQIAFLSGWPWFASGRVGAPLDKVFPLADAAAAHAYLESGGHLGKVVLQVLETAM